MVNIRKIHPKIKWCRILSRGRNHAVLMIDSVGSGLFKGYNKKIYKVDYQVQHYRQFDESRWIGEKDYQAGIRILTQTMKKNPAFLYSSALKMEKFGLEIIKLANKYKKIKKWSQYANKDLIRIFEKFYNLEAKLWWGGP